MEYQCHPYLGSLASTWRKTKCREKSEPWAAPLNATISRPILETRRDFCFRSNRPKTRDSLGPSSFTELSFVEDSGTEFNASLLTRSANFFISRLLFPFGLDGGTVVRNLPQSLCRRKRWQSCGIKVYLYFSAKISSDRANSIVRSVSFVTQG